MKKFPLELTKMNLVVIPEELISEIFLSTGFFTCIKWNRQFETKKIFNAFGWIDEGNGNLVIYNRGNNRINIMDYFASIGCLVVIKWLHYNQIKCTQRAMDYASKNGYLEVVKWLHFNTSYTRDEMNFAAIHGQLEIVKWLHCNISYGGFDAWNYAAKYGHIETVRFIYYNNPIGFIFLNFLTTLLGCKKSHWCPEIF